MKKWLFIWACLFYVLPALAQDEPVKRLPTRRNGSQQSGRPQATANSSNQSSQGDSLGLGFVHRVDDSVAVYYRYLDSLQRHPIDSTIDDFYDYYSIPASWQNLGNNGAAAFPLVYEPFLKPGWDAGLHAYDVYRLTVEDTRFYKTTRPFSMLGYQLAGGKEQMIQAMHTQNPRPNLNFGFDYHLISAPGFFTTQNTNHNGYRLFSNYQGRKKRYTLYVIMDGNNIRASENGGIVNDSLLSDPNKKKRFSIPVNLGDAALFQPNPFKTNITTGTTQKDFNFFVRQSYDIGKKDSVAINDSTTEYLFYPRLRLQYGFRYETQQYTFRDKAADSTLYKNLFNIDLRPDSNNVYLRDKWSIITNDFTLVQFPDTKNTGQYLSAGAALELIQGKPDTLTRQLQNVYLHGAYKNLTRNKKWDITLNGSFYVTGFNIGDYAVHASLDRQLSNKWGNIQLYFNNTNRTPSFIFNTQSAFNFNSSQQNFNKENIISFGGYADNPFFKLGFANHFITNYAYFSSYYKTDQYSKPINILQFSGEKKFTWRRKWNLYSEAVVQVLDPNAPIRIPLVYTRNRFAFEGIYFKNLNLSTGLEIRYFTHYKANNFSPVPGQFVPQDTMTLSNRPDVNAFLHFRIKGFTGYIRAENLNTVSFDNGFGFLHNNFSAPHYPTPGFLVRFGIRWWFVN
ncbi:MAG: putative porin [Ferruginibacter sp.]